MKDEKKEERNRRQERELELDINQAWTQFSDCHIMVSLTVYSLVVNQA